MRSLPNSNMLLTILLLALLSSIFTAVQHGSAQSSDVQGSVTLAGGRCSLEIEAQSIFLGTWVWNGYEYLPESGGTVANITYRTRPPARGVDCLIHVQTDGLFNTDGNITDSIGPGSFGVAGVSRNPQWVFFNSDGVALIPWEDAKSQVSIRLLNVPGDVMPGSYEGSFVVTITKAD